MKRAGIWGVSLAMAWAIGTGCGARSTASDRPGMPPEYYEQDSMGDGTTKVAARGTESVRAMVGPPGGSLELGNGARLEVPEGAIAEPTEVTFGIGAETSAFDAGQRPIGPTLLLQPAIQSANGAKLVVSIPSMSLTGDQTADNLALATEEAGEQRALDIGGQQTRWQNNPVIVTDSRIIAELSELPGMRLQFLSTE